MLIMNKREKPKLISHPAVSALSTILGIMTIYNGFNQLNDFTKLIICISIVVIILAINIIIYYINVNKLYNNYEDRIEKHEALAEQYNEKNRELAKKEELIKNYASALSNLWNVVFCLLMAKNEDDIQRIKNEQMAKVMNDFSIINYLNGGNNNER